MNDCLDYCVYGGMISDAVVYGLNSAVKASKYPMSVDTRECNHDKTDKVSKLATAPIGSGHDNFLNGIIVQFDLTFSVKMSVELQRYHFIDFVSSQSTMHRITKFDLDEAYNEYVDQRIIEIMKQKVDEYNAEPTPDKYLELLYSNPCGMRLTARMTTNYRQLKTIYAQRKRHRLPEWRTFCEWVKLLPHSEWITGGTQHD